MSSFLQCDKTKADCLAMMDPCEYADTLVQPFSAKKRSPMTSEIANLLGIPENAIVVLVETQSSAQVVFLSLPGRAASQLAREFVTAVNNDQFQTSPLVNAIATVTGIVFGVPPSPPSSPSILPPLTPVSNEATPTYDEGQSSTLSPPPQLPIQDSAQLPIQASPQLQPQGETVSSLSDDVIEAPSTESISEASNFSLSIWTVVSSVVFTALQLM